MNPDSRGINFIVTLTCLIVFAITVTNCIVYSKSSSSGSAADPNANSGVSKTCTTIMLVINVAASIVSFLGAIYFGYRFLFNSVDRAALFSKATSKISSAFNSTPRPINMSGI